MEIWDLYDVDRQKTTKTMKKCEKFPKGEYYSLRINMCLFNSRGEMLIQQRHSSKKHWPNLWDLTLSGGAISGDNSRMAITREIKEELGLDIDFSKERPFFTINNGTSFNDYYLITKDIDINKIKFQDGEVQAVKWASKEEILKMIKNKEFLLYYPSFIEFIFDSRKNRGVLKPEGRLKI